MNGRKIDIQIDIHTDIRIRTSILRHRDRAKRRLVSK